jgi:hypothetical protein
MIAWIFFGKALILAKGKFWLELVEQKTLSIKDITRLS